MRPNRLPQSRMMASFVATVQCWSLVALLLVLLPALPDQLGTVTLLTLVCITGLCLHYRCVLDKCLLKLHAI